MRSCGRCGRASCHCDMKSTAQRFNVPAGFSGHWCTRCEKPAVGIPEEAGSPAKCPKCRHYTVWWIPQSSPMSEVQSPMPGTARARAGEARALSAGPEHERKRPRDEDAKRLFDHVRNVIENPELNPDLRALDEGLVVVRPQPRPGRCANCYHWFRRSLGQCPECGHWRNGEPKTGLQKGTRS